MIQDKSEEELQRYNSAYIATAVRWAIRNELRNRYKWYSLKHTNVEEQSEGDGVDGEQQAGILHGIPRCAWVDMPGSRDDTKEGGACPSRVSSCHLREKYR